MNPFFEHFLRGESQALDRQAALLAQAADEITLLRSQVDQVSLAYAQKTQPSNVVNLSNDVKVDGLSVGQIRGLARFYEAVTGKKPETVLV